MTAVFTTRIYTARICYKEFAQDNNNKNIIIL
jgi:hypothetical protein